MSGTGNLNMVVLQTDGNFVIYNRLTHKALWATGTFDASSGTKVVVEDDGHLAVLSGAGAVLRRLP